MSWLSGINLVNSLSGLLIVTSLLVIEVRPARWSAIVYSIQSLILVCIFVVLAYTMRAPQLYLWAASAFLTKVILVPWILYRAMSRVGDANIERNAMGLTLSLVMAAIAIAVSFLVIDQIQLRVAIPFKPALAISMAHFFFGELCILTQRNIYKQILGFCLMENGASLTLALLAYSAPELVEIGVAIDAVFGVIIMVVLANQIYRSLNTLDTADLRELKG
jgi:hydrogenase-4 component E